MNFKIGDQVKIKNRESLLKIGCTDRCDLVDDMLRYAGMRCMITRSNKRESSKYLRHKLVLIETDRELPWVWIDPWLEPVVMVDIETDILEKLLMK